MYFTVTVVHTCPRKSKNVNYPASRHMEDTKLDEGSPINELLGAMCGDPNTSPWRLLQSLIILLFHTVLCRHCMQSWWCIH